MPITGPSSYIPTTAEFLAHWTDVNATLPPTAPLVLEGGGDLSAFSSLRDALLAQREVLEAADLEVELARATLLAAKVEILAKLNLFNGLVRGQMGSSVYAQVLSLVPGIGEGQEGFSQPMVKARNLWAKINAAPPAGVTAPVVLLDGTTQGVFAAAVLAVAALYDAVTGAEQEFSLALKGRNQVQDALYPMMKGYRLVVPTRLPADDPLVVSLPALSPESGRTPDPVGLSGAWDAGLAAAQLTATVSSDPDLKDYELRWCAGAVFSTETDHVVGTVPAGEPPVFVTTKGLTTSGAVASFRVFVRLTGGGEAGSETVVVARP